MRRIAVAVALAVFASIAFAAPTASATSCGSNVYVRTYKLTLKPSQDVYLMGETAEVTRTLTRKESGLPVPGARIAFGLFQDDKLNYAAGVTDAAGRWVATFDLNPEDFKRGPATGTGYGYTETGQSNLCLAVHEYGYKRKKNLFRIL